MWRKLKIYIIFTLWTEAVLLLGIYKKKYEVYTRRGGKRNVKHCVCLHHKKYTDVVTATSLLSFVGFLFRFPCLFADGYQETVW
jgi:hypothetical protein